MTHGADPGPVRSAVVTVGDELLLGRTVDTNAAWLASRLSGLGARPAWMVTVGDEVEDIVAALEEALSRADLVVVSGGLGPTADDRTRDAASRLLEAPLEPHDDVLEALSRRYEAKGEEVPDANLRVADVPRGGTPVLNPVGTAPGLLLDRGGATLVLLPGVPRELRALWERVEPSVLERFPGRWVPVHTRTIHTTGIPESRLAPRVDACLPGSPGEDGAGEGPGSAVAVAYLPDLTGVDLRLSVRDPDPDRAAAALDAAEARLEPVVGPWRFDAPSGDLAEDVLELLAGRGWTVALGESCTGGLVAKRLTDVPGASRVVCGGVVAYSNEAKSGLLGVPEALIREGGAVSEAVARALASGARERFGASAGVGITGIAGPGGGSDEKPVGTVHMAVCTPDREAAEHHVFSGDREAVRIRAAQAALDLLRKAADGRPDSANP